MLRAQRVAANQKIDMANNPIRPMHLQMEINQVERETTLGKTPKVMA